MTQLNKLKEAAREAAYDGKAFEFVLGIDFDSDEQWLPDELAMINQGITGAQKKREGTDKKIDKDNEIARSYLIQLVRELAPKIGLEEARKTEEEIGSDIFTHGYYQFKNLPDADEVIQDAAEKMQDEASDLMDKAKEETN